MIIKFLWFKIFGFGFGCSTVTLYNRTMFSVALEKLLDIRIYLLVLYIHITVPLTKVTKEL